MRDVNLKTYTTRSSLDVGISQSQPITATTVLLSPPTPTLQYLASHNRQVNVVTHDPDTFEP